MDEIRSSIILEKNELMYLARRQAAATAAAAGSGAQNANVSALAEYTGVPEPDEREAVRGLSRRGVVSMAGHKLVIVNLFDFYIRKLVGADSVERTGNAERADAAACGAACAAGPQAAGRDALVFRAPGIILLAEVHRLSQNHISIRAFREEDHLMEFFNERRASEEESSEEGGAEE